MNESQSSEGGVPRVSNMTSRAAGARCSACGYDLRGIDSERCPECGTARAFMKLRFLNENDFDAASLALARGNLPVVRFDPRDGIPGLARLEGGIAVRGEIWIGQIDSERAIATLDDAGVYIPLPVVDRTEPKCPGCEEMLDPAGPEVCPSCRTAFTWIDAAFGHEEPLYDHCPRCGYDLTGVASQHCPECGRSAIDVEQIVASASGEPVGPPPKRSTRFNLWIIVVPLAIAFLVALGIVLGGTLPPISMVLIILIALAIFGLLIVEFALVVDYLIRASRK